ncbi:helix-turn-helix domain-containing protein, partial [Helicobacter japonicus]
FLYTRIDYFNQTQRQIIARELNIQIETLSRILQKMFQQGLIAKDEHNDIYIKDTTLFTKIFGNMKKID